MVTPNKFCDSPRGVDCPTDGDCPRDGDRTKLGDYRLNISGKLFQFVQSIDNKSLF